MANGRMACLAIGVGDTEGGLDYLDGALHAARDFHEWSSKLNYDSVLLTDDTPNGPPTLDNIRNALEQLLPFGSATERLIIYFAGHGLTGDEDSGLWIPSDWRTRQTVVSIDSLRRRLAKFGVGQVSLISDACNAPAITSELRRLDVVGLLGDGFERAEIEPTVDRFLAAQDGKATYMIPGADGGESHCLFTGVLLEGLWGHSPEAFSKRATSKVISQSLAGFLTKRAKEIAELYKLPFKPNPKPGFLEESDVYYDKDKPPPIVPPARDWPPPPSEVVSQALAEHNSRISTGVVLRFDHESPQIQDNVEVALRVFQQTIMQDSGPSIDWTIARSKAVKAAEVEERVRSDREAAVGKMVRDAKAPDGSGELLVVEGQIVKSVWHSQDIGLQQVSNSQWRIVGLNYGASSQLLVEFENDKFGACVAMWGMSIRMMATDEGVAGLILQPTYSQFDEIQASIKMTEDVLPKLYAGTLTDEDKTNLAVELRMIKHVNPVLGVISAYLYDSIGDTPSIRRMAYFYANHGQAIPYDIVYLANLWTREFAPGQFEVTVPAQEQRKARTKAEEKFEWVTQSTPEIVGRVAGRMPWLRQGWPYLESPSDAERMMAGILTHIRRETYQTPFTTLTGAAGRDFVGHLGMVAAQKPSAVAAVEASI